MSEQGRLFADRGLPAALTAAHDIVAEAVRVHRPEAVFLLLSGGNDSMVLLDAVAEHADAVVHINTQTGVPATSAFARTQAGRYPLPFIELFPPVAFEELILSCPVFDGLPGPGIHHIAYQRLKERCVEALLQGRRSRRGARFLLLTGVRKAESRRRMGYKDPVNRKGGQVWANPLLTWSNAEMAAYRQLRSLPESEVAANLHMSGECLCGAMANQGPERGERAQLRFFYPEVDARISGWEEMCRSAGKTYCEWGVKRPAGAAVPEGSMELCVSCEWRTGPA